MSFIKREIRHFQVAVVHKRERNVQKRCDGTCKVVVLLFKPIVLLTFSLPSASLDLKVPNIFAAAVAIVVAKAP